ncbi:thioredoxin domain-containing protein 11-like isoform X2 [Brachyhypopomus gauderio]|uniref:thioredoxin domain-containing protein 11-like isoform X2 n=1 Tax=Brachyhypopomus gauderio TaxID=698409 RepID=UPI00404362BA
MLRRLRGDDIRQLVKQMARRPAVLCGAALLTCALVLAIKLGYSRAKSVVVAARVPVRFFPTHVPVVDLFLGQQEQADSLCEGTDVCLLFYYAPWCAHSVAAREHIQQVALRLAEQVQFVAVNCWWSQGKCRKQKTFDRYPVVHLHYRRFGPIEYKGPFEAHYVESFIRRVVTPLTYLPSRTAVHTFKSHHEGVIGFFEFNSSPQPPAYVTFLSSALLSLKRDSQGAVRFGVVTNPEVAEAISVREDETVYLYRHFNRSLVFPRTERNFTPEAICDWVYENRENVIHWILPMGTKSYSLEAELHKGPALLTFLPHNPLRASQQLLSEVADIVLRYHSCCWSDLQDEGLFPSLLPHSGSASSGQSYCQSLLLPGQRSATTNASASVCELCLDHTLGTSGPALFSKPRLLCFPQDPEAVLGWYKRLVPVVAPPVCSSVQQTYNPLARYSVCCRSLRVSVPPHCPLQADALAGLRCRSNRTLHFYLLDSRLSWPLARRLGALGNRSTFSTIVDLGDETHYVLEDVGKESLEHFILNFSTPYSTLHRHLVGQRELNPPQFLIQEVTTHTFMDVVMDPERDVLVFYYTSWCGFCTVMNHVLLRLALLFQGNSALLVARVNVALNDLPWEFMVDHLPSVLFFPRHRKQMSVKFPEDTAATLPNLVRFILQHTSHSPQGHRAGPKSLLEAELRALQGEVLSLQQARERLSKQLTALWHENHRLALHAHALQSQNAELMSQNAELQAQSGRLQTQYREKSRQLGDAVRRLQDLAAASKDLLTENSLLKVLLRILKERESQGEGGAEHEGRDQQETS